MKIIVLQLARLGDIYQTWPTLNSLRRHHPTSTIHLLCRKRFAGAAEGLTAVDQVKMLDTAHILEPSLVQNNPFATWDRWNDFVNELCLEDYDLIIDLTMTEFSSRLVRVLESDKSSTRGLSRYFDGSLSVADRETAYFMAQVGVTKNNRIHLTDVFAGIAGVDLQTIDFRSPLAKAPLRSDRICVHLGTSDPEKGLDTETWIRVLRGILNKNPRLHFDLVGSQADSAVAHAITSVLNTPAIADRTGTAKIHDLFNWISRAKLVLGCDSVAMHMASLCQTPCFNLSFASVNFWETGPISSGSVVFWRRSPKTIIAEDIADAFVKFLEGDTSFVSAIENYTGYERFKIVGPDSQEWTWVLLKAIYFGQPWPALDTQTRWLAVERLYDIVELAREELSRPRGRQSGIWIREYWARIDELMLAVANMCPELAPLIRWFDVERAQIGPGGPNEVLHQMNVIFTAFSDILVTWQKSVSEQGAEHGNSGMVPPTNT